MKIQFLSLFFKEKLYIQGKKSSNFCERFQERRATECNQAVQKDELDQLRGDIQVQILVYR